MRSFALFSLTPYGFPEVHRFRQTSQKKAIASRFAGMVSVIPTDWHIPIKYPVFLGQALDPLLGMDDE